jgi:hypothetical protein
MSLAVTTSELLWITSLLQEIHFLVSQPPTVWCDNLGATFLASNPIFHAHIKYIELDYHFVRKKISTKQLSVQFICSADQLGDLFTKSLPRTRFQILRTKFNVFPKLFRLKGADKEVVTQEWRSPFCLRMEKIKESFD